MDQKLQNFQNLSGISNEDLKLIRRLADHSTPRYVLAKVGSDNQNPLLTADIVNFKKTMFIESMVYKNGIFFIVHPGYYEVTINLQPSTAIFEADMIVSGRKLGLYGRVVSQDSLNMSTILKLELYDIVHLRIRNGQTTIWFDANNFQIRKINPYEIWNRIKPKTSSVRSSTGLWFGYGLWEKTRTLTNFGHSCPPISVLKTRSNVIKSTKRPSVKLYM